MSFRKITIALAMTTLALPALSQAADRCSNANLRGSYGLHATGTVIGVGNFAAVGRFTFDGNGSLSGKLSVRLNGNSNTVNITGTYSVSAECTVSDVWILPDGSSSTHESVLVNEGKEYYIINTTAGEPSVISGEAKRQ